MRFCLLLGMIAGLAAGCSSGRVRGPVAGAGSSSPLPVSSAPIDSGTAAASANTAASGRGCTLSPTGKLTQLTIPESDQGRAATSRTYDLYVPKGITASSSVPLLVSLHGTGANGAIQNGLTHWSAFDDAEAQAGSPFVLALPDGLKSLWFWGAERSYDVTIIFDVIAQIQASGCIDPRAIYIDGWSEGAYMAQRMACADGDPAVDREGIHLAAVHGYAGGNPQAAGPACGSGGRPAGNVPILLSQGLDDTIIKPQQMAFPALTAWGTRYGCHPPTASYETVQQLSGCRAGTSVAWWPIQGFGHVTWSCPADEFWHNKGVWAFLTSGVAPATSTCS